MNEGALMQYISYQLHTYIRKFNKDKELTLSFCAREDLKEQLADQRDLYPLLFETYEESDSDLPHIFSVNSFAIYTVIPVPDGYFLVGPTRFDFDTSLIHPVSAESVTHSLYGLLAIQDYPFYIREILLIYNLYQEQCITEDVLMQENFPDTHTTVQKNFHDYIFKRQEEGTPHNPYEQEVREQTSIEQGDTEALKKSIAEDYAGTLGVLASQPLRNTKNLGVVVITLASRSAIRGGMLPEIAFSMSDNYIQQIENMQDIPSILRLIRNAEFEYTEIVHDIKEKKKGASLNKNPYINQCKNYIFSHLHDKITVQNLADELSINANYLSGLFKKQMGISLSRYILEEKINRAKNLLTYSQYSYSEIAAYLGFSSQSHFSAQFKQITGYTPKAYRDTFGVKDF